MLNIGVMGLGYIAQQAYLPVYAANRQVVNWHLMTRNEEKLANIQQQYRFASATTSKEQLLAQDLDAVMIHTPTSTHTALIREFLEAGVHVFVDKPISEDYSEVEALYQLAADKNRLLMAGFNRRFVPMNRQLAAVPDKNTVTVLKTRVAASEPTQYALFDLLIHPVDTALYLAGFPTAGNIRYSLHQDEAGNLEQAGVTFTGNGLKADASVNMLAGANYEEATVYAKTGIARTINLNQYQQWQESAETTQLAPDWQDTLETRGFAPMVRAFIDAVAQDQPNPVSPESSLMTHRMIANLAEQVKSSQKN